MGPSGEPDELLLERRGKLPHVVTMSKTAFGLGWHGGGTGSVTSLTCGTDDAGVFVAPKVRFAASAVAATVTTVTTVAAAAAARTIGRSL
jgi:hypothetical protein